MKVEYWPAKFLFTSFMDGDGVEVSHLDRTNLVNKGSIHYMDTADTPEGVRYMGY